MLEVKTHPRVMVNEMICLPERSFWMLRFTFCARIADGSLGLVNNVFAAVLLADLMERRGQWRMPCCLSSSDFFFEHASQRNSGVGSSVLS